MTRSLIVHLENGFGYRILKLNFNASENIELFFKIHKQINKTRLESTGTIPGIWNLEFGLWTLDFFYGLRTEDDSGLPTRPLTITKILKTFL